MVMVTATDDVRGNNSHVPLRRCLHAWCWHLLCCGDEGLNTDTGVDTGVDIAPSATTTATATAHVAGVGVEP